MPKKQVEAAPEKKPEGPQLPAISTNVMSALGRPEDLLRVHVQQLWDDHYRVNVYVGANAASARVAHSFFVVGDTDGNIVSSTPPITRQYDTAP